LPKLLIFDPPQSCSSGVCGPDGQDEADNFETVLDSLREEGIEVGRFNLGYDPRAFLENAIVKQTLDQEGIGALPLAIIDNVVLAKGGYPTREALKGVLGRTTSKST
jgi:Arsenical resistance operon protein ArsD